MAWLVLARSRNLQRDGDTNSIDYRRLIGVASTIHRRPLETQRGNLAYSARKGSVPSWSQGPWELSLADGLLQQRDKSPLIGGGQLGHGIRARPEIAFV